MIAALRQAPDHGLDPSPYRIVEIERRLASVAGSGPDRARTEQMLRDALIAYAHDLRAASAQSEVIYVDPELKPAAPSLETLLAGGAPADALRALHAANPLYEKLRAGLAQYRRNWAALPLVQIPAGPDLAIGSRGDRVLLLRKRLGLPNDGPGAQDFDAELGEKIEQFRDEHGLTKSPVADSDAVKALNKGAAYYERIIIANLDRLRGLPLAGSRYVLVDTIGAQVSLIERGKVVDTMRAVVGKPGMETPLLAANIRYAMINPYWNVPPDLVRNTVAPLVMKEGTAVLARHRYILSPDWQSDTILAPGDVDWPAIAEGRSKVWVRQLPGGNNMMGDVKFMLPNDFGIYLHDTPNKSLFLRDNRRLSSGCVRLEDAGRLAKWLFENRQVLRSDTAPDKRIDLPKPVPVFITYLTAEVVEGRVLFKPDIEKRDERILKKEARTGVRARSTGDLSGS